MEKTFANSYTHEKPIDFNSFNDPVNGGNS